MFYSHAIVSLGDNNLIGTLFGNCFLTQKMSWHSELFVIENYSNFTSFLSISKTTQELKK